MPKMTHPEAASDIEVSKDQVANYEAQGWTVKPASKPASRK